MLWLVEGKTNQSGPRRHLRCSMSNENAFLMCALCYAKAPSMCRSSYRCLLLSVLDAMDE